MSKNVLMIGGDSRNREIIDKLMDEGYSVYLLGFENLTIHKEKIYHVNEADVSFSKIDAIILPVHGTSDTGEITSSYSNHTFTITKKMLETTPKHCVIYTGITNDY